MQEIPYFIRLRGCINCNTSKCHKERHGSDYGFDHELQTLCIINGCVSYGVFLASPFIDPAELVEKSREFSDTKVKENVRRYCLKTRELYGKYYAQLGISLDDIINSI